MLATFDSLNRRGRVGSLFKLLSNVCADWIDDDGSGFFDTEVRLGLYPIRVISD